MNNSMNNSNNSMNNSNNNVTTTSEKKEAITMTTMTAREFKQMSYDAYLSYVAYIEGAKSADETITALSPIMSAYGFTLTVDNLGNTLTVKMTAYGKDKGEEAKKVKSITTFRSFIKGGWAEVMAAPTHSNAGKAPSAPAAKKPGAKTKADLEAELAELKAQMAALMAANA